jgi:hypothetical protein
MMPYRDSPYVGYLQSAHRKLAALVFGGICSERSEGLDSGCPEVPLTIGEARALLSAAEDVLKSEMV